MDRNIKIALSGAAAIALLFAACSKNEGPSLDPQNGLASVSPQDECLDNSEILIGSTRPGPPAPDYDSWDAKVISIGNVEVSTEGMFNSFFRPATENYFIGTVEYVDTCATWDDIKGEIQVKNWIDPNNLGTYPLASAVTPQGPYNVVGVDDRETTGDYNLGYYGYNAHVATPTRAIVIWKDETVTDDPWYEQVSDPVGKKPTEAYLIVVQSITPNVSFGPAGLSAHGVIPFRWKQLL